MKQLQTGAILYGSENNDSLPANVTLRTGGDTSCSPVGPNWVDGDFWSPDNAGIPQAPVGCETNAFYLGVYGEQGFGVRLLGSIGPYAKAAGIYHCPADVYAGSKTTYHQVRVRSCSANQYLDGTGIGPGATGYKIFKKFSNFTARLSASDCFLYLDENPSSLNDGWFAFDVGGTPNIHDRPAVNHGKASAFSFVDGHAEIHRWVDVFLTSATGGAGGKDTIWLNQHGTCKN